MEKLQVYADQIIKAANGSYYTKSYADNNDIEGAPVADAWNTLRGKTIVCNYSQIFYPDSALILCNNISSVDGSIFENIENGSFYYYQDIDGNVYDEEEKEERIAELEAELEELEELEEADEERIRELEADIDELNCECEKEVLQYYIIDDSTAQRLTDSTDELVFYSNELDVYILAVTHWGTSWNYVRAEFTF